MNNRPTTQCYSDYTAEDFRVWTLLFNRQMRTLRARASRRYLESLDRIGFCAEEIPDFRKTNVRLLEATGWQLTVAPGLVPHGQFFALLARKAFPATCWLRTMQELDYLEEPDMFHDVFGHVPLLADKEYASFMEAFGQLGVQWLHHPEALQWLSRVYWFTIEFGLIREHEDTKIFGAGILSSVNETKQALASKASLSGFDIDKMLHTPYRTDRIQEHYFVIHSFEELYRSLPRLRQKMEERFSSVLINSSL